MSRNVTAAPASIVIYVGGDLLGDGLMKLPFLQNLRRRCPAARITWATLRDASIFSGPLQPLAEGLIDEVVETIGPAKPGSGRWFRRPLAGRRFDLAIDTQLGVGFALWLRRTRARLFVSAAARWALSDRRPRERRREPLLAGHLRRLLETALGEGPWEQQAPALPSPYPEHAAELLPAGPRYLGLSPGAGGAYKRWPAESFVALAHAAEPLGFAPVLLLGPKEAELVPSLRQALPRAPMPLQEAAERGWDTGPLLGLALAGRLALAVANDSGIGHLLAAGGAPLVSLFGPTDPAKFAPAASRLAVVRAQDHGGREMAAIPLTAVLEKVRLLAG